MATEATGLLGQVLPVAATNTLLFAAGVPAGRVQSFTLTACATGADTTIRVALLASGATIGGMTGMEWIEYNSLLLAGIPYVNDLVLQAGQNVVVWSASGNVAFNAYGADEPRVS